MADNLVIVESPAKAKTINKFLGKNYVVKASMGHVRDLPKSKLGVDVEKNFEPHYITIRTRAKLLKELKALAKKSKHIFLATDPDREGEAIGWHLGVVLQTKSNDVSRILFHEITKSAVLGALKAPRPVDLNLVGAQQARRVLDRLVGYSLSPLLWKNVRRGLSAGRVQSVALRVVVERETEILAFKPEEYWDLHVDLRAAGGIFSAELASVKGIKAERVAGGVAQGLAKELPQLSYAIKGLRMREQHRAPAAPFITSSLQQEAAKKLRFTAKRTMVIAQQLYEGLDLGAEGHVGLITYMRTDSVRVAVEAQVEARALIVKKFGPAYLPENAPVYKSRKQSQDAHEAVRPTLCGREPDAMVVFLTPDQAKLYRLIWSRFMASQMQTAIVDQTSVDIVAPRQAGDLGFKAHGSILRFDGWMAAWPVPSKASATKAEEEPDDDGGHKGDKLLPDLLEGEALAYVGCKPSQHFTQAPPRYNDASLVKVLEEQGIGRPSTYAPIISTILDRMYVERIEGGRLKPTELGTLITSLLVKHFEDVLNVKFTAALEEQLDRVEEGALSWQDAVASFYKPFLVELERARVEMKDVKKEVEVETSVPCPLCATPMIIKWGRYG